jgi:hypothetical protein
MGRMILCTGVRAKTPYCFELSEAKVYSMEELVFYLYRNLYGIQDEALDESLAGWIGAELKLPETAKKLSQLVRENAPAKERAGLLFRSCHYYSEEEIAGAEKILEEIAQLSPFGRLKLRAENSLRYHNYVRASYLYENLLKRPEASKLAPEEYGEILHNQALAHMYTMSCVQAAGEFREAYINCRREESLLQYLYALLISGKEEEFLKAAKEFHVGEEKQKQLRETVRSVYEQSEKTTDAWQLRQAEKLRETGKAEEYYEAIQRMVDRWKKDCRKFLQ